jgi:hypothetical protein
MYEVEKYGTAIPVSDKTLRDWEQDLANAASYDFQTPPAERAEYAARAAQLRAAERKRAETVEPTAAALGEKFRWSPEAVRHLVQPYCRCDIGHDGWEWCRHAYDEGLVG